MPPGRTRDENESRFTKGVGDSRCPQTTRLVAHEELPFLGKEAIASFEGRVPPTPKVQRW